jgi:hypothetical protein
MIPSLSFVFEVYFAFFLFTEILILFYFLFASECEFLSNDRSKDLDDWDKPRFGEFWPWWNSKDNCSITWTT